MAGKRQRVPHAFYSDHSQPNQDLLLRPMIGQRRESSDTFLPAQKQRQPWSEYETDPPQPPQPPHPNLEPDLQLPANTNGPRPRHLHYAALPTDEISHQSFQQLHGETHGAQEASDRLLRGPHEHSPAPITETIDGYDNISHAAMPSGNTLNSIKRPLWKPYFLRRHALLVAILVALLLGLVVIFLLVYSTTHHGIGSDNNSSAVLFGWRFMPTLVTVLYAILTTLLFNDAVRTEPFAQMSHLTGASSQSSLFMSPKHWWTVLVASFKKHDNHGHLNYFLLAAVLVNIISFLFINPLSSALLQSQYVDLVSQISFSQYEISEENPLSMTASDLVYFRTIGNVLQNLTTSAWLTDQYAVVPFWPSSGTSDLGTILTDINQQWEVNTTVLSVEFKCEEMTIHTAYWSRNFTGDDSERNFHALLLKDSHGCEVGINGYTQYMTDYGGGSWYAPPEMTLPVWDDSNTEEGLWNHYYNSTEQCYGRQVILSTSANGSWQGDTVDSFNENFKAGAWSCDTTFYAANMLVATSTTTSGTTLAIDDAAFQERRSPLQETALDQARFETAFLHENWTSMIYTADINGQDSYGGPSALLAAIYDFDSTSMIGAGSLLDNAQRIKQSFLGEMVMATISSSTPTLQSGQVTVAQRRVVVNLPIAISLALLFILSAILIAAVLFFSNRRLLNLHDDPASVGAVTKLVDGNKILYDCFRTLHENKNLDSEGVLASTRHFLLDGIVSSVQRPVDKEAATQHSSQVTDWRPFAVRRAGGLSLFLLLGLIFAAILILFIVAQTAGLYEAAFTYQTDLDSSNIFTFAPYSIVPTLLAVIITLWWDNLDEIFRRLQPFVTMAQRSVPLSPIVGLSYVSTISIASVVKAARNRHWLVGLVGAGSVLAQVLTVSMSALWQRVDGTRPADMTLTRTLEPRTQPFVYTYSVGTAMGSGSDVGKDTLADFYSHLSTNWLYSATLQLAYNGLEPPWSRDGWSFVPVELSAISESQAYKDTPQSNASSSGDGSTPLKNVNVTLVTPAIRGTVECSALNAAANLSSWSIEHDLTDSSTWNISVNPSRLDKGFEIKGQMELGLEAALSTTPILARDRTLLCCMNTSGAADATSAIGYWSTNFAQYQVYNFQTDAGPYPRNFTMKWIRGTTAGDYYIGNKSYEGGHGESIDFRHLIFSDMPRMTALNCQPRIEWSNASVTVDMATNQVWDYTIDSSPQAVEWPWSDVYLSHNYSEPGDSVDAGLVHEQISVSFGVLFQDAMLLASDLQILWPSGGSTSTAVEDLSDKNFNFRRPEEGLNTDLMSYTMYQLANGDLDVLMDPKQMAELGQKVFTTFFQHFVSSNRSSNGGWAYQRVGATLPSDLGPALNASTDSGLSTYQTQNSSLTSDTNARVHLDISVEILQISPVAVYISLVILFVMALITIFVSFVAHSHFGKLKHDFSHLASVVSVVYDSQKLQEWIRAHPAPKSWARTTNPGPAPNVRLGAFMGAGAREIWGVELVGEHKDDMPVAATD